MPGKKKANPQSVLDSMTGPKKKKSPAVDPLAGFKGKKKKALQANAGASFGNSTGDTTGSFRNDPFNVSRSGSVASTAMMVSTVKKRKKKNPVSTQDFTSASNAPVAPGITFGSPLGSPGTLGGFDANNSRPSTSESATKGRIKKKHSLPSMDSFKSLPSSEGRGSPGPLTFDEGAPSPERRNSVGSTYNPSRKKRPQHKGALTCDSAAVIQRMRDNEVLTLESLFDQDSQLSSPMVLAYVMKDNFALLSVLVMNLFKVKNMKRNITEATVSHLSLSYDIALPEQYQKGDVPAQVVCEVVQSLPMARLELFVSDSFNLAGMRVQNSVISKPVFASYLLRYNLGVVWDEMIATRSIVMSEIHSRQAITEEEDGGHETPHTHLTFYLNIIKPNLAAAKVQRCWKCRSARKEIQRRVFMRKHRVCADADDPMEDDEEDEAFRKTWKTTRGPDQGKEVAEKVEMIQWLTPDNIMQLCVESTYLLCSMMCKMLDIPSPLSHLENRHVLWVTRAYGVVPEGNVTLHTVCQQVKAKRDNIMSVIDDALRLASLEKLYNGMDSTTFLRLLVFFECTHSLGQELNHFGLPSDPLLTGVFNLLARVHMEEAGRDSIVSEYELAMSTFKERSREYITLRKNAIKAQIKIQNAQSSHSSRPLTDFKTDKDLMLYGAPSDYEKVIFCQSLCRSHLARKHFKRTLAMFSSAKKIQKYWKIFSVRRRFQRALDVFDERRQKAILLLQRHARMWLSMRRFRRDRCSVVRIQNIGRGCISRRKIGQYVTSCVTLQRLGRSHIAKDGLRISYLSYRAIRIQNLWRQMKAKRAFEEARIRLRSLATIQRVAKGGLGRSRLRHQISAEVIQRIGKGMSARLRAREQKERPQLAARTIQKQWRIAKSRELLKETQACSKQNNAALSIQQMFRNKKAQERVLERKEEVRREKAAVKIQCMQRRGIALKRLEQQRTLRWRSQCATLIQQYARVLWSKKVALGQHDLLMAKKYFDSRSDEERRRFATAASSIQRCFRCFAAKRLRRRLAIEAVARTLLHRIGRGHIHRARTFAIQRTQHRAVACLTRIARGGRARHVLYLQHPTETLQRLGRGMLSRGDLLFSSSAPLLQRLGRGLLGRDLTRQYRGARLIKRVFRGYMARLYFKDTHGCASLTCGVGDAVSVDSLSFGGVSNSQLAALVQQAEVGRRALRRCSRTLQCVGRAHVGRVQFGAEYHQAKTALLALQRLGRAAFVRWCVREDIREEASLLIIKHLTHATLTSKLHQITALYKDMHKQRKGKWVVQRVGRAYKERSDLLKFKTSVGAVQRVGRACVSRACSGADYYRELNAAACVQRVGRGGIARFHLRQNHAACMIQRAWRCYDAVGNVAARRHLLRVSKLITRVFAAYKGRYVLLTRSQRSAKVLQMVGRGLSARFQLRCAKRAADQQKAIDILRSTDTRVCDVFYSQWRRWMEMTVQKRLSQVAQHNQAFRLLLLTDNRTRKAKLSTFAAFVEYSKAARFVQRIGRAVPHRDILYHNHVAAEDATAVLQRVALGHSGRNKALLVHTSSVSSVAIASLALITARRVQAGTNACIQLLELTASSLMRYALKKLAAYRLVSLERKRQVEMSQSLFERTTTMKCAECYRKLTMHMATRKVCHPHILHHKFQHQSTGRTPEASRRHHKGRHPSHQKPHHPYASEVHAAAAVAFQTAYGTAVQHSRYIHCGVCSCGRGARGDAGAVHQHCSGRCCDSFSVRCGEGCGGTAP